MVGGIGGRFRQQRDCSDVGNVSGDICYSDVGNVSGDISDVSGEVGSRDGQGIGGGQR